jgi:hypothetical protein
VLAGELRAALRAAFPPRSLGAPSSRLIARRENSAAALRSLAGFAGTSRLIARRENSAAALRSLAGSAGGLLARWPAPPGREYGPLVIVVT